MNIEYEKAIQNLKELKQEVFEENQNIYNTFQKTINGVIGLTPTGDLRNEITNLHILFNQFVENSYLLIKTV